MVSYVLDSSAILRYLHNQAGAQRVAEIISGHLAGDCEAMIAAPHWGEVAGITCKLYGKQAMKDMLSHLTAFEFSVIAADGDRSVRAALIKLDRKIPYVDAFGIELTNESVDRIFVTADFDFKPASHDINIEFLPAK